MLGHVVFGGSSSPLMKKIFINVINLLYRMTTMMVQFENSISWHFEYDSSCSSLVMKMFIEVTLCLA